MKYPTALRALTLVMILFSLPAFAATEEAPEKDKEQEQEKEDRTPPTISDVKFDGKVYFPSDIISERAKITALLTDESSGVGSIEVWLSEILVYSASPGPALNVDTGAFELRIGEEKALDPGKYKAVIKIWDRAGNISSGEFRDLNVVPAMVRLTGPSCHPLVFRPGRGESGNITYNLSENADLKIMIYQASSGDRIWAQDVESGKEGGREGLNHLAWDGRTAEGKVASNGIYNLRIVSGNRVLGSGSFIVRD